MTVKDNRRKELPSNDAEAAAESGNDKRNQSQTAEEAVEHKQLRLQLISLWLEGGKWVIGGLVIVIGFLLIRPREQERLDRQLLQQLFAEYISSQDAANLDLWSRKLELVEALCPPDDERMLAFMTSERARIMRIRQNASAFRTADFQRQLALTQLVRVEQTLNGTAKALEDGTLTAEQRQAQEAKQKELLNYKEAFTEVVETTRKRVEESAEGLKADGATEFAEPRPLEPGTRVIINAGVLQGKEAVVDTVDETGRIGLKYKFFGSVLEKPDWYNASDLSPIDRKDEPL